MSTILLFSILALPPSLVHSVQDKQGTRITSQNESYNIVLFLFLPLNKSEINQITKKSLYPDLISVSRIVNGFITKFFVVKSHEKEFFSVKTSFPIGLSIRWLRISESEIIPTTPSSLSTITSR